MQIPKLDNIAFLCSHTTYDTTLYIETVVEYDNQTGGSSSPGGCGGYGDLGGDLDRVHVHTGVLVLLILGVLVAGLGVLVVGLGVFGVLVVGLGVLVVGFGVLVVGLGGDSCSGRDLAVRLLPAKDVGQGG